MSSRLTDCLGTTPELAAVFCDEAMLGALLLFETALARAQARLGMIPAATAECIARVTAADFDAEAIACEARVSATTVIPFIKALTARVEQMGEAAAGFVHWGTTSQDVLDTALVLLLCRARQILERDEKRLETALRRLAQEHAGTMMLARTVMQPAPPITFGYKAAGWYGAVHRGWKRLARAFEEALQIQFGGAAGTLAAFGDRGPELAADAARELGLAQPDAPWQSHRDRLAALVVNCGILCASLGKVARDISLLMQQEVGEVAERGGGSSAMPNKRNPAGAVIAMAAAARMPGLVAAYLTGMQQEHERAAGGWQTEWQTVAELVQTTGSALASMADAVEGLTVKPERMRANLEATAGAVFAEKATMLMAPSLGRTAAQRVATNALKARTLREGLAEQPEAVRLLTAEQIENIDRPEDYLGAAEAFRRRLLEEQD
jgi:3-carboxy-cis,cis-muconate cycloisomerase